MSKADKYSPSNIVRYILQFANTDTRPTDEQWDELLGLAEVCAAKTIVKYAGEGRRPPELDYFDGEEQQLSYEMLRDAQQELRKAEIKSKHMIYTDSFDPRSIVSSKLTTVE